MDGHDHRFGQTSPDAIFNCIVKCDVFHFNFYLIRNTQYAIRNTQYAIDRTGRNDEQGPMDNQCQYQRRSED